MQLALQLEHKRCPRFGPLVLEATLFNLPTGTIDRDQPVSRRFEPNSRISLIGEQPNPSNLLQLEDEMSRHRGAKHRRRYELLGGISLLSPEYLLSVERWPFHTGPPDHYDLISHLFDLYVSQSSTLTPLHSTYDFQPYWRYLCTPPLPFRRRPPQSNCPPNTVLKLDNSYQLEQHTTKGSIPPFASTSPSELASIAPTYSLHDNVLINIKLQ